MDFLDCTKTFLQVAQHKNFSTAAVQLGISASNVSKKVRFLEAKLNTSLLNRTTRKVNLTASGELFEKRMRHLMTEVDDTILSMQQLTDLPQGWLKVAANTLIGSKVVSPYLPDFLASYEDVKVELEVLPIGAPPSFTSDITITTSNYEVDSLSFRRLPLADYQIGFYAAPEYLERVGPIENIAQLESLSFVLSMMYHRKGYLDLANGEKVHLRHTAFASDNTEALFENALAGTGMFFAPNIFVAKYIKQGRLTPVLPYLTGPKAELVALYPNLEFVPQKTRVFLDHLKQSIGL